VFQKNGVSSLCQFDLHISTFHEHLSYHPTKHHVVGRIFPAFLYVDQPVGARFSQGVQCNGAIFVARLFAVYYRDCDGMGMMLRHNWLFLFLSELKEKKIYFSHESVRVDLSQK
jgi:hypothetical protein